MIDCLIVGDSIAKGVSDIRKDCVAYVQSGISTHDWLHKFRDKQLFGKTVVISLGSNDLASMRHEREDLEYLRSSISADHVLWILPAIKPHIGDIITQIADNYGDTVLEMVKLSPDGVHPTGKGYKEIANKF
jgi:lysophospholipase L1-like esterase